MQNMSGQFHHIKLEIDSSWKHSTEPPAIDKMLFGTYLLHEYT